MRKHFSDILKTGKIEIEVEYKKIFSMFYYKDIRYGERLASNINDKFLTIPFRGLCLTFSEFNKKFGFDFMYEPDNLDVHYLAFFCEYVFNLVNGLKNEYCYNIEEKKLCLNHIQSLIDQIGYMPLEKEGIIIFVPKDTVAISVAESEYIPEKVSYKIIEYNHHSMNGDLARKMFYYFYQIYLNHIKEN